MTENEAKPSKPKWAVSSTWDITNLDTGDKLGKVAFAFDAMAAEQIERLGVGWLIEAVKAAMIAHSSDLASAVVDATTKRKGSLWQQ